MLRTVAARKRVDRLRVVAHDRDARGRRLQASRIAACSRLVSWYSSTSTWSNRAPIVRRDRRLGHHLRPVEQEVVVVEHVLRLLRLDVAGEERA